jgi:hypothetical protein
MDCAGVRPVAGHVEGGLRGAWLLLGVAEAALWAFHTANRSKEASQGTAKGDTERLGGVGSGAMQRREREATVWHGVGRA